MIYGLYKLLQSVFHQRSWEPLVLFQIVYADIDERTLQAARKINEVISKLCKFPSL